MAKSDTLFMTKTAEKPYPLAPHIPIYIAHTKEYPPPRGFSLGSPVFFPPQDSQHFVIPIRPGNSPDKEPFCVQMSN